MSVEFLIPPDLNMLSLAITLPNVYDSFQQKQLGWGEGGSVSATVLYDAERDINVEGRIFLDSPFETKVAYQVICLLLK